jgi:hypothetical protein
MEISGPIKKVSKKLIPDSPLNGKLQSKKQGWERQMKDFVLLGENIPALFLVHGIFRKYFLASVC